LKPVSSVHALAFSPDGKWLAGAGEDQKVQVWEVNTGVEVRRFQGHFDTLMSIAFAPDGRSIASGGCDSMILLWDFTARQSAGRLPAATWTPQEMEQRWQALARNDGPRAVQAIWDLVASPQQSVALLRQRIKPAQPLDAKHVERLIRDLDSEDFQTRTKTTEELEKNIDLVESTLRKKMTEKPSLEVRQRIRRMLSKLEPAESADRLRTLRVIQVLEYMGTPQAKEYLHQLANGATGVRLTNEAKAALQRLAKRSTP
jgi:hypothetical protein